jgi:hypothetical protein
VEQAAAIEHADVGLEERPSSPIALGLRREATIDISILDVDHDMAAVKVVSNAYVDYLELGYWNDQWWIVNVLWRFRDKG